MYPNGFLVRVAVARDMRKIKINHTIQYLKCRWQEEFFGMISACT
jgi:hypothetical protein